MASADASFSAAFQALCKGADTPVTLGMWLRYKHGEHKQLAAVSVDPRHYLSVDNFDKDYLVNKFVSKYTGLKTGVDTKEVAIRGWEAAEAQCRVANRRFRNNCIEVSPRVDSLISRATRKIAEVLGPFDYHVLYGGKWGPGSTFSLPSEMSTLVDKIGESPVSVTRGALPYAQIVIGFDPHWCESMGIEADGICCLLDTAENFRVVGGNHGATVPKTAKTDRCIAKEPTANVFMQLAIGTYIRRRLQRVGVNLDDQTRNQELARIGASRGKLATLDLSSASDTISRELVRALLPVDWMILLDHLRSPQTRWATDQWTRLEKFSSMGNGFTFELESLIFWSLAHACAETIDEVDQVGVYGDDIVVPAVVAPLLIECLETCGFSLNLEKTFVTGPFRESCGRHYWGDRDVTPIYQKEVPSTLPALYRLANRLYRCCLDSDAHVRPGRRWVLGAWKTVVSLIHRELCYLRSWPFIPGDTCDELHVISQLGGHAVPIWGDDDDGLALHDADLILFAIDYDPSKGIKLPVLAFRPSSRYSESKALLAYWLRFSPKSELGNSVPVRRRGRYVSNRRWYAGVHFSLPGAIDGAAAE